MAACPLRTQTVRAAVLSIAVTYTSVCLFFRLWQQNEMIHLKEIGQTTVLQYVSVGFIGCCKLAETVS